MFQDPPSEKAFDDEQTREEHTFRTKNIAPTRLNRELRIEWMEHTLDSIDGFTWVPNNRVEVDGGHEHEYVLTDEETGETYRVWHRRDGNMRSKNAIRVEPGFPEDKQWEIVEKVFSLIADNRSKLIEAYADNQPDRTPTMMSPTQYMLAKTDIVSQHKFLEETQRALDELVIEFNHLNEGDYDALETIIKTYRNRISTALNELGTTPQRQNERNNYDDHDDEFESKI